MHRRFATVLGLMLLLISACVPRYAQATSAPSSMRSVPQQGASTTTKTVDLPETVVQIGIQSATFTGAQLRLLDGRELFVGGQNSLQCHSKTLTAFDPWTRQFTVLGTMHFTGDELKAALLVDGRILLTGGTETGCVGVDEPSQSEVFNPADNSFTIIDGSSTQPPSVILLDDGQKVALGNGKIKVYARGSETAPFTGTFAYTHTNTVLTALADGTVLVADGSGSTPSEVYDPATGQTTTVGTMLNAHEFFNATLMDDGRVLITGGTAEVYDPATRSFVPTGSIAVNVGTHVATNVSGKVMLASHAGWELYDPQAGTFKPISIASSDQYEYHRFSALVTGDILIVGWNRYYSAGSWVLHYAPANAITARLTYPTQWVTSRTFKVGISAIGTATPVVSATIKIDNGYTTPLRTYPVSVTDALVEVAVDREGANTVSVTYSDRNGRSMVIKEQVKIDSVQPATTVTPLPQFVGRTAVLTWVGKDGGSGVAQYTVEARIGTTGVWQRVASAITTNSTKYVGQDGDHVYFRVRTIDVAGNVEAWPDTFDTQTTVDARSPTGSADISFVGSTILQILLVAQDSGSGVKEMRIGYAPSIKDVAWEPFAESKVLARANAPEGCQQVLVQFRDGVDNRSSVYRVSVPDTGCAADQHQVFLPLIQP